MKVNILGGRMFLELTIGAYFAILSIYIVKCRRFGSIKALNLKLILSGIFCSVGIWKMVQVDYTTFSILIVCGLVFSLIGDYYLVYIHANEQKFIKGIFAFGLAHIFYISAMTVIEGLGIWEFVLTGLFALCGYIFVKIKKPQLGKAKWPLLGYMFLVTFMAVKGGLMMFSAQPALITPYFFSVGAVMFLLSDMLLGIWRYIWPKPIFSDLLSLFYFCGQILLALSR